MSESQKKCERDGILCLHYNGGGTPDSVCAGCDGFEDYESPVSKEPDHTPLPYHIGTEPGPILYSEDGSQIASLFPAMLPEDENQANGKFIELACNSHYAMLAALEEAEKVLIWAAQEARGRVKAEFVGGWIDHAVKIKAAIAQAKA